MDDAPAAPERPRRRAPAFLGQLAALGALAALAVVVRRPGYVLSHSYWLDESWVIDSVRAPLDQLELLTSSTPIGWTLLLRLVPPIASPERHRLLALAFGVASVVPAWFLGRHLGRGWTRWLAASVVALAVAIAPAALARHDLKQYTADAFVTLAVLALLARLEARWTAGRLVALAAFSAVSVLVSHAAVFASAAALGAAALICVAERRWRRLAAVVVAGALAAAAELAVYLRFVAKGNNPILQRWWAGEFVPLDHGARTAARFVAERMVAGLERAGFGPWPLTLALVVLGIAGLWLAGLRASALFGPLLAAALVVAGAAKVYPLLDERTSLFFSVLVTFEAAAGLAVVAVWLARRPLTAPLAAAAIVGAGLLLVPAAARGAATQMPEAGVRQQVAEVLAERQPGDVIVVNHGAQYGFGWYWPERPAFEPTDAPTAVRYRVAYPGRPELVVVPRKEQASIELGLARAAAERPRRIWIVLGYGGAAGLEQWRTAAEAYGTVATSPIPGGLPYLVTVTPAAPG